MRILRVIVLLAIGLAFVLPVPALSSLFTTQFGFPVIVQRGESVAFSSDVATATDLEVLDIDFPAFEGLVSGPGTPAAMNLGPTIGTGLFTGGLFDFSRFKFD